jgi:hypothetical protein
MIRQVYDKVTVVRWILLSDCPEKEDTIRSVMNGRIYCHQFITDKVPYGWILWHRYKDGVFVDYINIKKRLNSLKKELTDEMRDRGFTRIRMMTTRPKPWGRFWGGFKTIGTIMEKEI